MTIWGDSFQTLLKSQPFSLNAIAVEEFANNLTNSSSYQIPLWVAVGDTGKVVYSSGNGWMITQSPTTANLISVHVEQGNWIATGNEGTLLFSNDGITWNHVHSQSSVQYVDAAYDKTGWMVVGSQIHKADSYSKQNAWFARSPDGLTWNAAPYPNHIFRSIATTGQGWIVAGHTIDQNSQLSATLLQTEDGSDWKSLDFVPSENQNNTSFSHISFGEGYWIAVMENPNSDGSVLTTVYRSSDLRNWTEVLVLSGAISKPDYSNNEWTFTHQHGTHSSTWPATTDIYHSFDGAAWRIIESVPSNLLSVHSMASILTERVLVGAPVSASILTVPRFTQMSRQMRFSPIDVEESNGIWIAVGNKGNIAIREPGLKWTTFRIDTEADFVKIIAANGIWIAMAKQGELWSSTDGYSWKKILSQPTVIFTDLQYGAGQWIAAGYKSDPYFITTLISTNLEDWSQLDLEEQSTFASLDYGNGTWHLRAGRSLWKSDDPINWEIIPLDLIEPRLFVNPFGFFSDGPEVIVFGDGKWITGDTIGFELGGLYLNENGFNWEFIGGDMFRRIWHEGGLWWAISSRKIAWQGTDTFLKYSADGHVWRRFPLAGRSTDIITKDNVLHMFNEAKELSFIPGISPTPTIELDSRLTAIAPSKHHWLATGDKATWISADGINWTPHVLPPAWIHSVAFGRNEWRMIGIREIVVSGKSETNLTGYTYRVDTGFRELFRLSHQRPRGLVYAFDKWWMLTQSAIYLWDDKGNLNLAHDASSELENEETLQGLSFSNQSVIAFTDHGTIFKSDQLNYFAEWSSHRMEDSNSSLSSQGGVIYTDLTWANGQWLMVGGFPRHLKSTIIVLHSPDGKHWTSTPLAAVPQTNPFPIMIAYGNNHWKLVGSNPKLGTLDLFESSDGKEWNHHVTIPTNNAEPIVITYNNHQWLLAMSDGTIHRSGPDTWLELATNLNTGRHHLSIFGKANAPLQIQTSTNLEKWHNWRTILTSPQPGNIDLPEFSESEKSFYSIRQPPQF